MRTTLNLDDSLMRAAKRRAAERETTLTEVIEDALREAINPAPTKAKPFRLELPTVEGRQAPGVDVADREALYDLLDPPRRR